jgi:uncharacterized protein (DUF1501 family)
MLRLEKAQGVASCDGLTRRDFLRAGSLAVGLGLTELAQLQRLGAAPRSAERACIQLLLVGGPGQLDTWDLKPDAPDTIRGPFRPIATNVPGIEISEHFPRMARRADRYALLRSVFHSEPPIHESGHQLLQTGHLSQNSADWPHQGAVVSAMCPRQRLVPPWVVLPAPLGNTGVSVGHGQTAGVLGPCHGPYVVRTGSSERDWTVAASSGSCDLDPAGLGVANALSDAVDAVHRASDARAQQIGLDRDTERALNTLLSGQAKHAFGLAAEPEDVRARYGWNTFGQSCLLARRLVQHGVGLVTVNMFDTVFGQVTWDCHANGGDLNSTLDDYRTTLCPMLDQAHTALLDDLEALGLLDQTLVLAAGEFGRTPRLNPRGGRDHWPGVWSMVLAGGGVRGGQVIGASDAHAEEPRDRPIHLAEVAATVYHALGIDPATRLPGPDGRSVPLMDARPVLELFS